WVMPTSSLGRPRHRSMERHRDRQSRGAPAVDRRPVHQAGDPVFTDARSLAGADLTASGVGLTDTVLDVACGPGVLACAFAEVARHVTGIDITPAMIERAQALQQSKGRTNMAWRIGNVLPLR